MCILVAVAILKECCMVSTYMQRLLYSVERIMGFVLLYSLFWLFDNRFMLPIGFSHSSFVFLLTSLTIVQMSFATNAPCHYPYNVLEI